MVLGRSAGLFAHTDIASGFESSLVQLAALAVGIVVATACARWPGSRR
jgi:hypothetical protein